MVTNVLPDEAEFGCTKLVKTGESYVKRLILVPATPTDAETVRIARRDAPIPSPVTKL
jgi:hypothetical protein